ncbi:hypothetical protein BV22DRAFT_1104302 [Leucogyrophana mollusca]|uniref:Uncharacterized protein n=1 Tax=Leucogyrophana mollusca TaxID=85980 RepID=A0ACB8BKY2_9AGAM|nr:hypothetical protein BV22DRAFT_1104302 [Leucogyrophana mollusca]
MTMFTTLFLTISALVSVISAVPLGLRDVPDPPITSPTASTIWHVGDKQTVTWSTANLPANLTTPTGTLLLGFIANNSENLMTNSPLATGFLYTDGQAQITVPSVPTRENYIVVLLGDSGNASPQFTIIGDSSSSSAPSTSATTSVSSSSLSPSSSSSPSTSAPPASGSSTPVINPETSSSSTSSAPITTSTSPTTTLVTTSGSVVVVTTSVLPSQPPTGAAWKNRVPRVYLLAGLMSLVFAL